MGDLETRLMVRRNTILYIADALLVEIEAIDAVNRLQSMPDGTLGHKCGCYAASLSKDGLARLIREARQKAHDIKERASGRSRT